MVEVKFKDSVTTNIRALNSLFGKNVTIVPKVTRVEIKADPVFSSTNKAHQATISPTNWKEIVENVNSHDLMEKLVSFEKMFGYSTIEMFEKYTEGKGSDNKDFEEWVDTYILYLGLSKIRKYSCP
ncbi:MAG: hypothetical protein IPG44_04305 [Anaerolineales bacterium]|nr:hypothetical protein [Anaerolineales bacterium]